MCFYVHIYLFYNLIFTYSGICLLSLRKHARLSCVFYNKLTYLLTYYVTGGGGGEGVIQRLR